MPGEARLALDRAGVDLWKIVTTLATEKLTKVQEEAEKAIHSANTERDEALTEIERLETQASQKINELDESLRANELISDTLSTASNEIRGLEIKVADKARVETENERLKTELTELRSENKLLIDTKIDLIGQVKELENKLSNTEKELISTNAQLKDQKTLTAKLQAENNDVTSKAKELENGLLSTEKEFTKAAGQLKEKESVVTSLQTENNTSNLQSQKLQLTLDASESKATELKNEVVELRQTIDAIQRETGALSGELKAVTAENARWKTDFEQLTQAIKPNSAQKK